MRMQTRLLATIVGIAVVVMGAAPALARTIELEEAVDLALEHSLDYEIAVLNWENSEIEARIRALQRPDTEEERLKALLAERQEQRKVDSAYNNVIIETINSYFDLQNLQAQVVLAEKRLEVASSDLQLVERRVRLGELPELNLLREENRYANAETDLATAERNLAHAMDSFALALGLDEGSVEVACDVPAAAFALTAEELLDLALANALEPWERDINLRLAAINLEKLKLQRTAPLEIERAENNFRISELNAQKGDQAFRQSYANRWVSLDAAERRVDQAMLNDDMAQEDLAFISRQHERGLVTGIELTKAEIAALEAEVSVLDRRLDYLTSVLGLRSDLNLTVWPLSDEWEALDGWEEI